MGYAQRAARAWAGLATAVTGLSVVAVFGLATPAAADVSFDSEQGQRLGGARVAFRVTNESQTASITRVEVRFPRDVRIPEIYPIAVADWAPSITMTKVDDKPANDLPTAVVWITMPGKEIKPGATSLLPLAMGPMPDREAVYLDVTQTRSDGSTVTWGGVDVPAAGAQHPAFKLELVPLPPGQAPVGHHGGAGTPGAAQTEVAAEPVAEDAGGSEGSGTAWLAVLLLIIAALTAFALYRQRHRRTPDADAGKAEATGNAAPGFRVPAERRKGAPPRKTPVPAKAASASSTAVPASAKTARASAKAASAKAAAVTAGKVAEPAPVASSGDRPAVAVQRRTVVRTTAAKRGATGRRTVARKSTGGAATVTMARRGGTGSNRAGKTEGDNA